MFWAHGIEKDPLGGPCRLCRFICEPEAKRAQLSVIEETRAADKTDIGSIMVHLIQYRQVRVVISAEASKMCRWTG